jgi:signal transduction histidine kinase
LPIPSGQDELSDLAQSFNRMTEAVRGFLERERSFTRYTSHELRTPLATLRAQFEALEQNLIPRETSLPAIKNSLTRLERILSGLLALTRSPQSDAYPVPLDSVFQAIFAGLGPEDRPRVSLQGNPQALGLGYEELLQQALGNLISNALKFSQGPVTVTTEVGERIRVVVQDGGPGVPQATLSKLGEPFFRLQPQVEGLGLGLALTRHIAAQLGGTLEFHNRPEGGFRASLTLPKAEVAHVA